MPGRLTKKQKALITELHEISALLHLDFYTADQYPTEGRTTLLELAKRQIVLGEVVRAFTMVDELLNTAMCHYFFGKQKSSIQLWKTKKFQIFNHHILEELHPLQKLRLVKAVGQVPAGISQDLERLCALRNGLAHTFFPENLRKSRPQWKGKDIFSLARIIHQPDN
jgi:hypothetical protein